MNSPLKIAVTSLLLIGLACFAVGCGSGDSASQPVPASIPGASGDAVATVDTTTGNASATGLQSEFTGAPKATFEDLHPEVAIKTSEGEITVRLDAENAKYTVENFLENYVDRGAYDNTIFHQVEKDFIVLGGAFTPDLEPTPTRAAIRNEADNEISNRRGTIAMARDPAYPHSACNQFYFNLADNTTLDHKSPEDAEQFGNCVFGEVIEGMDVLDRIANAGVEDREGFSSLPVKTVVIESVRRLR